jgi:hypothetical protein
MRKLIFELMLLCISFSSFSADQTDYFMFESEYEPLIKSIDVDLNAYNPIFQGLENVFQHGSFFNVYYRIYLGCKLFNSRDKVGTFNINFLSKAIGSSKVNIETSNKRAKSYLWSDKLLFINDGKYLVAKNNGIKYSITGLPTNYIGVTLVMQIETNNGECLYASCNREPYFYWH